MSRAEVRRASDPDARAISGLLAELGYPAEEREVRSRLGRLREVAGAEVFVAERSGQVAGMVAICPTHLLERDRPSCRVTALVVRADVRRAGVGAALMEAVEEEARRQGCFRVEVACRPEREEAHAFYASRGFRERPLRFVKDISRTIF